MVEVIPFFLIAFGAVAEHNRKTDEIKPLAPPDPQDAVDKATEASKAVQDSRINASARAERLGPIQLQAPTLKI